MLPIPHASSPRHWSDPGRRGEMDRGGSRAEAERSLSIAEKLLSVRDLVGSKKFAEKAMDSDPLLDGVDQVLAVADVLLAAQRRINNHLDWYAILQLDPSSSDPSAMKRHYRRLALLLHPDKNRSSGANDAFKLVVDAWSLLSDPSKKALLDHELNIAAAHHLKSNGNPGHPKKPPPPSEEAAFWTACLHCCHVYQYGREYENRSLRCQNCRKAFHAVKMPSPPPIVPDTDMYYCSWGLVPVGFPGGPVFNGVPSPGQLESWRPPSWWGNQPSQPLDRRAGPINSADGNGEPEADVGSGKKQTSVAEKNNVMENMAKIPPISAKTPKKKKKMAVKATKKQTASVQKQGTSFGSEVDINVEPKNDATMEIGEGIGMKQPEIIDVNEEAGRLEHAGIMGETLDMNRFIIDLDATDEVLGNLSNLPFLKDEGQYIQPSLFDG